MSWSDSIISRSGAVNRRLWKMSCRGLVALIGGDILRDEFLIVVAGVVSRQRQQSDERECHSGDEDGRGPPNDRRADPPPSTSVICRFGSNSPKRLPRAMTAGTSVRATATATKIPTAPGMPRRLEKGQSGEMQAENRAGDRHTGGQNNLSDTVVSGVEGRFPVLAGLHAPLDTARRRRSRSRFRPRSRRDTNRLTTNVVRPNNP